MFGTNSAGFFVRNNSIKRNKKSGRYKQNRNKHSNSRILNTFNIDKMSEIYKLNIQKLNNENILKEGIVLEKDLKPKIIYRTWKTKPEGQMLIESNNLSNFLGNDWEIKWYDDNECREMIKNNFQDFVLNAYDSLIPTAYKADLWRYCCIYLYGGFYLDASLKHGILHYNEIYNNCDIFLVKDIVKHNIYQAIFMCKSGYPLLKKCILKICQYHIIKYKGNNSLDTTGPSLLGKVFKELYGITFSVMRDTIIDNYKINTGDHDTPFIIKYRNKLIVNGKYNGYKNYQQRVNGSHYYDDWKKGHVWKK